MTYTATELAEMIRDKKAIAIGVDMLRPLAEAWLNHRSENRELFLTKTDGVGSGSDTASGPCGTPIAASDNSETRDRPRASAPTPAES